MITLLIHAGAGSILLWKVLPAPFISKQKENIRPYISILFASSFSAIPVKQQENHLLPQPPDILETEGRSASDDTISAEKNTAAVQNSKTAVAVKNSENATPQLYTENTGTNTDKRTDFPVSGTTENSGNFTAEESIPYEQTKEGLAFLSVLDRAIRDNLHYPQRARKRNIEGRVSIKITILNGGNLEKAEIEQSSGSEILDSAAVRLIRSVFPLPSISSCQFSTVITIHYRLKE